MRNEKGQFLPAPANGEGGAPPGNQNALKLRDPDIRQEAYRQYCKWIGEGKSKESWTFVHPELTCIFKTMEKYIADNPVEFPPINKELAEATSLAVWEEKGQMMMTGKIKHCQPAIYQMFMRNKFKWDKDNTIQNVESKVDKILDAINEKEPCNQKSQ